MGHYIKDGDLAQKADDLEASARQLGEGEYQFGTFESEGTIVVEEHGYERQDIDDHAAGILDKIEVEDHEKIESFYRTETTQQHTVRTGFGTHRMMSTSW